MTNPNTLIESAPQIDPATARQLLARHWGIDAQVRELRAERDCNFLARSTSADSLVLKISNSAEDPAAVDLENAAMAWVQVQDPELPIPELIPARTGDQVVLVDAADGRRHLARLITVVPGTPADEADWARPTTGLTGYGNFPRAMGALTARMSLALQGFHHPAAGREIDWDPRQVGRSAPALALLPADRRAMAGRLLDRLAGLPARTAGLPSHPQHADVTLSNVLVGRGPDGIQDVVTGVIDFGDMHHTARVCDLAIALTSLIRLQPGDRRAVAGFLDGYQQVTPLEPVEVDLIGDLVLARLLTTVLISAARTPLHPDNLDNITLNDEGSWRGLEHLGKLDPAELSGLFHRMCGTSAATRGQGPDPGLPDRRDAVLGGGLLPLFYAAPLHLVRGDGAYLWDALGARYLDAYNNVPVVGHGNPAVAQAIRQQSRRLAVNARYLHANVVELAERLVATLPDGLDTCVFVNSGSEANDLAWRLAVMATGGSGAAVTSLSYHGVSAVTTAMSSNTWSPGEHPDFVGTFAPPFDPDSDRATGLAAIRSAATDLAARGHRLALTAVDPMFTSGGVLDPAPGFLHGLVDGTHAAGGLFLADEVQAGFGRSGASLWSFSLAGITPDFVTLGKPMGNGQPIAALITRRELVEELRAKDEFFSTFGGNPVSCAAALAVLDQIEDRGLIRNAALVGDLLREAVRELAVELPEIGAVRGFGLIAGIQIEPGPSGLTARAVAEELRHRGVLVGTTGPGGGALKVRPPLVWTAVQVAEFAAALWAAVQHLR